MKKIKVTTTIGADIELVWKIWTTPKHIENWNSASSDWHTPKAENNLSEGGRFVYRMEAKDGSFGFDMGGTYTSIRSEEHIAYSLDDGREVTVDFTEQDGSTTIVEAFEPEDQNPLDMQRDGWQAILDNFKRYVENQ